MEMQNINIPQVAYNIEQIDKLLGAIHKLASVSNDTVSSVTETLDRVIEEKIQQEIRSKVYLARELIGDLCFDLCSSDLGGSTSRRTSTGGTSTRGTSRSGSSSHRSSCTDRKSVV